MIFFFIFNLFIFSNLQNNEICKINNILNNSKPNCIGGQLMFGSFKFNSKNNQHEYEYNEELNIKIVKKYKKQILLFLKKNCDKKRQIKIKEIINLIPTTKNDYQTEVIISCIFNNARSRY